MRILIVDDGSSIGRHIAVALNSAIEETGIAICFEMESMESMDAVPPSSLMLVPPGGMIEGRDGRTWNNPDPSAIVSFYQKRGVKICIDIEHATEIKAPKGEAAPAMAWATDLSVRPDGSVWAEKVDWTPRGAEMVMNREYSYYSPAYLFNKKNMNLIGVKSIGLTNTPNLNVPALNSEQSKEEPMIKKVIALLGLAADCSEEAALNSISTLKADHATALNHANSPPLDKFVPAADYQLALNRAEAAEGKLADQSKEQLEVAINHEIDAALVAGKITPATKDYHIACCRQEGGLDRFKAFAGAAPVVADATGLDQRSIGTDTALNAEELKFANMFGNSIEDIKKYGQA